MRRTVATSLIAALAALAAGCTSATNSSSPSNSSPSPRPTVGQVGKKFTINSDGSKYHVTLLRVDQMAQPESDYLGANAGHHLAAAEFQVTAIDKTDENANNSATATGSNDQAYNSALTPVAAGTNFADGQILLQPGRTLVGWVSYELPNGVRITKVQWTPESGLSSHAAEWTASGSAASSPTATPSPTSPAASPTSPTPAASPTGTASPGEAASPENTVRAYFDAINQRDYQKAWALGGKNTTSSYSDFVAGFKTTEMVEVKILDLSGDVASAVVTARITALQKDGSTKTFQGEYTVKNGVIASFNVHEVK